MSRARRHAWKQGIAQHGALPPVRVADRKLEGVTCIRLDATVVTAHSDKELAEPNFKGFGHHPLIAACDNTAEPLAWMLRPGSAGSNTAADHLAPARRRDHRAPARAAAEADDHLRRGRRQPCPGPGAGRLASRHGYQVTYSVGWELAAREKAAIGKVPEAAWEIAVGSKGEVRERRADGAADAQDRRDMALDRGSRHRLAARPGHPAPHLTSKNQSRRTRKETQGAVEPSATRPTSRATVNPGAKIQAQEPAATPASGSHQSL